MIYKKYDFSEDKAQWNFFLQNQLQSTIIKSVIFVTVISIFWYFSF